MDRRLAAILHADVVGYSRLMEGAETRTFRELKTLFDNVWLPALGRNSGRLVNTAGDAMLVEFGSSVAAVRCAMELQVAMAERNAGRPPDRHVTLRIGLNLGEVIVDGDNIFGDEVNLAARIQALAEPGTVIVSSRVREAVEGKVGFRFQDLGDRQVKNISRPVRVHLVLPAEAGSDAFTVLPGAAGPLPSAQPAAAAAPPSRVPTVSAPVSRPGFTPVGPPVAQPIPFQPPPSGYPAPGPSFAPPPPQQGYQTAPGFGPAPAPPPPFPPGPSAPVPPLFEPPPSAGPYPSQSSVPTGRMDQPLFAPLPAGAWRMIGADRAGAPVDMRLEGALLSQEEGIIFGRMSRYCQLTVENDSISRRHARFRLTGGTLTVEDLNSTNGTAVDGRRLAPFQPAPLQDGSRVSLGEIKVIISRS